VLFYDPACQKPYSARSLSEGALGGTEATVIRIAEALDARVMQHNRTEPEGRYLPPRPAKGIDHLVVLRDPRPLRQISASYPGARVYLWLHDLVRPGSKRGRRLAGAQSLLAELAVTIVCVSDFQRRQAESILLDKDASARIRLVTIYNPVDDGLAPDGSAIDTDRLVFFSSPNKGLAFALDAFQAMRREIPGLRLRVGSPGYKSLRRAHIEHVDGGVDGVDWLGPQPPARILSDVRSALCVFYPNFVLPETFGLVLAEAKAVGTPVLTHDCGAASEILADPRQVLPITRAQWTYERAARLVPSRWRRRLVPWGEKFGVFAPYLQRLRAWREGERPHPGPDARFGVAVVAARWRALLGGELT
jgi:glycosyltransferase involved in cell wall biosynthesis